MPTDHIVALLIAERDKINRAIEALGAETKRRGRPPGSGVKHVDTTAEPAKTARRETALLPRPAGSCAPEDEEDVGRKEKGGEENGLGSCPGCGVSPGSHGAISTCPAPSLLMPPLVAWTECPNHPLADPRQVRLSLAPALRPRLTVQVREQSLVPLGSSLSCSSRPPGVLLLREDLPAHQARLSVPRPGRAQLVSKRRSVPCFLRSRNSSKVRKVSLLLNFQPGSRSRHALGVRS